MAEFKTPDDVFKDITQKLEELGEDAGKKLRSEMLDTGAEIMVEEWKGAIERHEHIDTEAMRDSVAPRGSKAKSIREIYPQGTDKKGVRNAEKAYIAHYGKSGQIGTRFVDEAEENGEARCVEAMQNKLDDYIKKKGL